MKSPFNIKLKELRTSQNLTQYGLAKKIHTSSQSISDWETGKAKCDLEMLIIIAKFFNVSTDYLLGLEDF